jgi:dipeptidyl aminopeptidase/acylaminoacyl peptidase
MKKVLLFASLSAIASAAFAQNGSVVLKPADVLRMSSIDNPQVSPDAKWVAYSLSVVDTAKDSRVSHLWMQTIDGDESIELSYGSDPASNPRWSPDNKYLAYLSSRDSKGESQVWLMDRRGGEGKKITDIKGDINEIGWSPDARKMVLVINDPENKGKTEPKTPAPIVIDRYHFKHDMGGYLQHQHTHPR